MTGTAEWIGECAYNALIEEVNTTPKPGLVDLYSNGAHTDMDAETFRRSAEALRPFFVQMAREGLSFDGSAEELFMGLRDRRGEHAQGRYIHFRDLLRGSGTMPEGAEGAHSIGSS